MNETTPAARYHQSSAYIHQWDQRTYHENGTISKQARFVLRLALACAEKQIPYQLTWDLNGSARATIRVDGPTIPLPRQFPKYKAPKVPGDWKPSPFEAVYRLDAFTDEDGKQQPGFALSHSCGLSLVRPGESDSGELESGDCQETVLDRWRITHTSSGGGFGLSLPFNRAVRALLKAAASGCDWSQSSEALTADQTTRRISLQLEAEFGDKRTRETACLKLKSEFA
jgi:hypothetical protein